MRAGIAERPPLNLPPFNPFHPSKTREVDEQSGPRNRTAHLRLLSKRRAQSIAEQYRGLDEGPLKNGRLDLFVTHYQFYAGFYSITSHIHP